MVTMSVGANGLRRRPSASQEDKAKINGRVKEFAARFKARHGSITCRDLLGCDISQPQGAQDAADKGVFVSVCRPLVQDAVQILEQMMQTQ